MLSVVALKKVRSLCPHFTAEETETQGGVVVGGKSQIQGLMFLGFKPRPPAPGPVHTVGV